MGGGGGDNSSWTGGVKDRESVAARRLAALTNQQGSSSREGTSSESGGAQADLQRLQVSGRMSDIKREAMADAASKRSRLSDKKGNLVANRVLIEKKGVRRHLLRDICLEFRGGRFWVLGICPALMVRLLFTG